MLTIFLFWFVFGIVIGILVGSFTSKQKDRRTDDQPLLIVGPNGSVIIPETTSAAKDHPAIKQIVEKARKAGL